MSKIKIWIGTFNGNNEEYLEYFDENTEFGFCRDIDEEEYDPDFIGIIPLFNEIVNTESLVKETPLSFKSQAVLLEDCRKMHIYKGNALLFYSGQTRKIEKGEKFNNLTFIGEYDL
ncbi:immunity 22 family protein [Capnocytophaga canimorsus]|uniref:immunity 22 family protein n=1 Tax=Capnocytophaga canimorsus TaxID=28188 RepID=UPI0037CDECA2